MAMKKNDSLELEGLKKDSIGEVRIVKDDYLFERQQLTDGFYGFRSFGRGKMALIKFNKKSLYSYHPQQDLELLAENQKAFFPIRRGIEGFLLSEQTDVGLSLVFQRLFASDMSIIFKINKGNIEYALINLKRFKRNIKKFWGVNLTNYQNDLEIFKKRKERWWSINENLRPNHFFLDFQTDTKLKFTAVGNLKSLRNKLYSCEGEGNLVGPEWSDMYECSKSSRFYKKYYLKFRPFMSKMEKNRKIKYSVQGHALSIHDYANNFKSGWSVELWDGNSINPKKFNFANLTDSVVSQIRQATHYVDGEKDGKQILYYPCGSPSKIYEYKNGKRHGLQIKFFPKNQIDAYEFNFDLSCEKNHEKIMNIELYKDGSKVTNPFLIASTIPNKLRDVVDNSGVTRVYEESLSDVVNNHEITEIYEEYPDADPDQELPF